nr:gastrula zinc finger protein XlCGF57.1-like [Cherax quadricarinatus]
MVPCAADELPSVQVSSPEGGGANVKNKARNCVLSRTSTTRRGFHPRNSNATKDYICELCSKSFHKRWHLIHHLRMHTGEKPHRCGTCDKAFTQKGDLTRHLRIHTGDKPYKCDDCNKAFTHKSNLVQHSRRHTGEKPFQCHDCSKSFSRKSVLIQHVLLHSGHKPYTCDQCHKLFSRKGALIKHKWSHTGKWPYQCDQCNKGFSDRTHMDSHMRSHNGEKPYECDECGKTFADKSNLCRHIKMHSRDYNRRCQQCGTPLLTRRNSHTPQKPNTCRKCLESFLIKTRSKTDVMFKCDICEKEFTLKSNLAQHLILHTNVKPYSCQVCGKEFSHRSNLARHRNIHTQAGTHKCSFCDKVFSRIITFNQHMKSHEKSGLKGELRVCVDSGTNSVGEEAGSRNMNVCVESASQAGDPNPTAEATNGTAADENGMSTNSEESDTKENIATVQQTPHDPGVQSRLPMVTIPRENIVEIKTEREGDERYGCITQQERNVYNAQSTITVNCNTVLTSGATHHVSDPTQEGKNTKRNASATTNGLQCQRGHGDIPMVTIPAMNILEFKKEKDNDSCAINQTGQSMSVLCGESVTTQEHSAATSCSSRQRHHSNAAP